MTSHEVKVRITSTDAEPRESTASFATGGTTSGLVAALEKAKIASNDVLTALVAATKGQDDAREEELLEECDPAANEEPDLVEEQLHIKSLKKKSKPSGAGHPVTRLHQLAASLGLNIKTL